jgi:phosphonate transport system substrate-binding protein
MVRRDDKGIQGIVVVRKDSPIQSLNELQGERIAFPSPAAFAATLLPQGELAKKGINIEPVYVSSHDSVYLSVAGEFFKAGGGIGRTLANTKPEIRDQLRVLWKTESYTPHAVAAHPRVSDEVRAKITEAFLTMNTDPKGQALLQTLSMESITAAQDSDWDDVRSLKLHLLDSLLK